MGELREATDDIESWKQKCEKLGEEVHELYISMAQEVHEHETEKENFEKELTTRLANKGRPLDELSPRQRSKKLKELKSKAEKALFFTRSFGLMPAGLEFSNISGKGSYRKSISQWQR